MKDDLDNLLAVAALQRVYPEIIKPALESQRAPLDPAKNPVKAALLDAYLDRMEVFYHAGELGADERLAKEIDELAPWVNPSVKISADRAHSGPLGEMLHDAGYEHPEIYRTLEGARKANIGRPVELIAIEVLEMSLVEKKSQGEIADDLLESGRMKIKDNDDFQDDDDELIRRVANEAAEKQKHEKVRDRVRKYVETLQPIYEKYKKGI